MDRQQVLDLLKQVGQLVLADIDGTDEPTKDRLETYAKNVVSLGPLVLSGDITGEDAARMARRWYEAGRSALASAALTAKARRFEIMQDIVLTILRVLVQIAAQKV